MEFFVQWCVANTLARTAAGQLAETLSVPQIIANILVNRGIDTYERARLFFQPEWDNLNDPFLMKDMDKAVDRLLAALTRNERIFIYGDYDVDGITSVSLLTLFLRAQGGNVVYYIPDRMREGYGLSETGIRQAIEAGTSLMVTVDCGITAVEEVLLASQNGIDVIISDHHEPSRELPKAIAILDPKRDGCMYPFKQLAGVGVAYKLIQAIGIKLGLPDEEVRCYIDLVALGSAADIVPMIDENRVLVHKGLERINKLERIGIHALVESSGLQGKKIGTGQVVFILAPRINAVGRLGDAERAVHLLLTNSYEQARDIAGVLEIENKQRKSIDEETFQQALGLIDRGDETEKRLTLVLSKEGWHPGVIGIVASRIVEKVYKPTVMIAVEDGVGKGSARSISNFDIHSALKECEQYLIGYGGHRYAAGLTIALDQIEAFRDAFETVASKTLMEEDLIQKIYIDAEIELTDITDKMMRLLNRFAPFGPQNMRPVFLSRNLKVVGSPRIVGRNHLKFKVQQHGAVFDAIGFDLGDMQYCLHPGESNLDMVYVIEENHYNDQVKKQLRVKDLR
ncbi:single-stranded-DNA-specific exonuclease RecJ [bacterium]|nr:single-stranded-DNA-specific exonuclease RecJ [bacterium]